MLFGIFTTSDKKKGKEALKPTELTTSSVSLARRASRSTSQSSNDSQSSTSSQNQNGTHYPQNFVPFAFIHSQAMASQEPEMARKAEQSSVAIPQAILGQTAPIQVNDHSNADVPFAQQRMIRMPSEVMPQITRTGALLPQTHEVREATIPCLAYKTPRATVASEDFGAPPTYECATR